MTAPCGQSAAQIQGRFWPAVVHIDPPRRPDGSIDVPALCRWWDDQFNTGTVPVRPAALEGAPCPTPR